MQSHVFARIGKGTHRRGQTSDVPYPEPARRTVESQQTRQVRTGGELEQ